MKREYFKKLLVIAVPIMLSNVISQLQMIIDRIFLGKMDTHYMSVLGNATSPLWTTMSFCFTIVLGASILISQNVGANNPLMVERYAASMIKWNNVIPILLFFFWIFGGTYVYRALGVSENLLPLCVMYTNYFAPSFLIIGLESSFSVIMQTSNYTKPLIYYGIVRAGLNVLLDWILIFGKFGFPEMGIKGAAIATTIAEYAGFFFSLLVVVMSKSLKTKPSVRSILSAPLKPFLTSIRLGINAALEDTAWNLGNLMLIRILNSIDEMAAGIYAIVFSLEVLIVVVIGAIGNGTMTLSGEARGKDDLKQFKGICKVAYLLCVVVATVTLLICIVIPHQILSLFTKDQEIILGCGIYLLLVCLNLYGKSANIILGNGIRGSGNTIWMLLTQLFGTVFVVGCAALFVYVFDMGMAGVFVAVIVDELVRAAINLVKFRQISRQWKQKLAQCVE